MKCVCREEGEQMRRGGLELYIARECQGLAPRCGFRRVRKLFAFGDFVCSSTSRLAHACFSTAVSQAHSPSGFNQAINHSNNQTIKKKNNQARPSRAFKSQTSEGSMLVIGSSRTLTHMASERSSSNPSRKATVTTKVPYRRSRLASAPRTRPV